MKFIRKILAVGGGLFGQVKSVVEKKLPLVKVV